MINILDLQIKDKANVKMASRIYDPGYLQVSILKHNLREKKCELLS